MYNAPRDTFKPDAVVIGGCIEMQRPSDTSTGCDCFQVSFIICHNLKSVRITMCREWARYMAGHLAISSRRHATDAWGQVIREAVQKAFPINYVVHHRMYHIHSSTLRKLIEPLGYFPSYFDETVMDNRYGTIVNSIPLRDIAEQYFSEDIEEWKKVSYYKCQWTGPIDRLGGDVFDRNYEEHRKFRRVLDNIANHAKAIDSIKEHIKKRGTRSEDFAAVLLHLSSTEAKTKQPNQ
jgi:hypothetical protein